MRCANCEHPPESHYAEYGPCYKCSAEHRCAAWEPKSEAAERTNPGVRLRKFMTEVTK